MENFNSPYNELVLIYGWTEITSIKRVNCLAAKKWILIKYVSYIRVV